MSIIDDEWEGFNDNWGDDDWNEDLDWNFDFEDDYLNDEGEYE